MNNLLYILIYISIYIYLYLNFFIFIFVIYLCYNLESCKGQLNIYTIFSINVYKYMGMYSVTNVK